MENEILTVVIIAAVAAIAGRIIWFQIRTKKPSPPPHILDQAKDNDDERV